MALYEMTDNALRPINTASYADAGIRERQDLQRLLRDNVDAIGDGLLVIAEEYREFEASKRRIDLLAVDGDANLVVIELKRDDAAHMELQALRYAAMVSAMTWRHAVETFGRYLAARGRGGEDADVLLREHFGRDDFAPGDFARRVRVVLVSGDFHEELTSAVLWLNTQGLDITCVELVPHRLDDGRLILDARQVIPLPEAADYQVKLKEKAAEERADGGDADRYRRFWRLLLDAAPVDPLHDVMRGRSQSGTYLVSGDFAYYAGKTKASGAQYWLGSNARGDLRTALFRLNGNRAAVESAFGGPLAWNANDPDGPLSVRAEVGDAGDFLDESKWPALRRDMIDAMVRLEAALRPHLQDHQSTTDEPAG